MGKRTNRGRTAGSKEAQSDRLRQKLVVLGHGEAGEFESPRLHLVLSVKAGHTVTVATKKGGCA